MLRLVNIYFLFIIISVYLLIDDLYFNLEILTGNNRNFKDVFYTKIEYANKNNTKL